MESFGGGKAPFLVRWDPLEPHLPCRPTASFAELYPPEKIGPWPSWPDPLENKPEVQRRQRRIWGVEGWTWEQWQPTVQCYLGTITELDAQIGRILAWLDERGLAENTLLVYTTDHGDFCGGHGQLDKHFAMYDDLVQVPLLMRWPGRIEAGKKIAGFVSQEIDPS